MKTATSDTTPAAPAPKKETKSFLKCNKCLIIGGLLIGGIIIAVVMIKKHKAK